MQTAKVTDLAGAFVCDASIGDMSSDGIQLTLDLDCDLPSRFALNLDVNGEVLTVDTAWRRGRTLGVCVVASVPPAPSRPSVASTLREPDYALRD